MTDLAFVILSSSLIGILSAFLIGGATAFGAAIVCKLMNWSPVNINVTVNYPVAPAAALTTGERGDG